MSTSAQTTALRYALLASGAVTEITSNPWRQLGTEATYPPARSGGVDVSGVLKADLLVNMGFDGLHRRAWISFDVVDLATTYQLQFGAASVTYDAAAGAPANLTALIAQWVAAILADADSNAVVLAEVDPDDAERLRLTWRQVPTSIILTVGGSTAEVQVAATAKDAVIVVFGRGVDRVVLATDVLSDAAREMADGWAAMTRADGSTAVYSLSGGGGLRTTIPCAGVQALTAIVDAVAGWSGDAASGGASAGLAYEAPWVAIAPCPVS